MIKQKIIEDRNINWPALTAVIVCHDVFFGPPHELRDYLLKQNIRELIFIGHRNRYIKDNSIKASYMIVYRKGKIIRKRVLPEVNIPESIAYLMDFIVTLWWCLRQRGMIDYYIGVGNLNALAGLVLRTLGLVKNVIYYSIDYIPQRFSSKFLNTIYHAVEYVCASFSDNTWNYSQSMIRARENKWKSRFPRQDVVPNGIHLRPEVIRISKKFNRFEMIYVGSLEKQQGLEMVMTAVPFIQKNIPAIQLSIIGKGSYRSHLEKLRHHIHEERRIRFLGYIEDPVTMEKRLAQAAIGVAMYVPDTGFVQYTEPGKVKRYLACGIPVIMTNVSPIAHQMERMNCGICSMNDPQVFALHVVSLLKNQKRLREFRNNAVKFVLPSEWDAIYRRAFQRVRYTI